MSVVVDGTPEVCLGLARSYFESDEWPYRAESRFEDPIGRNRREVKALLIQRSIWFRSCLGVGGFLFLTLVTGGLFALLWFCWIMLYEDDFEPSVSITADAVGPSQTRIDVNWYRMPELAVPVEEWVQRELVENRAAAPKPTGGSTRKKRRVRGQSITEQIRDLAKLRDSGAITSEEFEAKKAQLLDRI